MDDFDTADVIENPIEEKIIADEDTEEIAVDEDEELVVDESFQMMKLSKRRGCY